MTKHFVVNPRYAHLESKLKSLLENFETEGDILVQEGRNIIKKSVIQDVPVNIKKFKVPAFPQRVIYTFFRKSKAKRSYEYALRLLNAGINTPEPIAFMEVYDMGLKESFYISRQLNYDFDFRVLNHNPKFPDREEILRQFTRFTYKLHEHNINFLDHSPGNTLIVKRDDENYDFYLIDLNRMRFEPMDFEMRMKNFRRLWPSKGMIAIMADEYAKISGCAPMVSQELMTKFTREFQKKKNAKKLRNRKKRDFKKS